MTAAPSTESDTVTARAASVSRAAKVPLDLNAMVETTAAEARTEWESHSEFEFALDAGLPPVPGLADALEQAIAVLIDSAAGAIRDTLATSGTKGTIAISTSQRGDLAQIKITDNGSGASGASGASDDLAKDLTTCRSTIVEQHGGTLEFEMEPGVGTTVTVSLPLHIEEQAP
ncbi:MAG TPA: ATP-binding protein [Acidimicrobiia bacterium]